MWMEPAFGIAMRQACDAEVTMSERASMKEVSIIGVDLAKNVFQLHGAAADGTVLFRKKLSRPQFQRFMSEHPQCLVAM
jgi:transposase